MREDRERAIRHGVFFRSCNSRVKISACEVSAADQSRGWKALGRSKEWNTAPGLIAWNWSSKANDQDIFPTEPMRDLLSSQGWVAKGVRTAWGKAKAVGQRKSR